jgi:hypothetical protein
LRSYRQNWRVFDVVAPPFLANLPVKAKCAAAVPALTAFIHVPSTGMAGKSMNKLALLKRRNVTVAHRRYLVRSAIISLLLLTGCTGQGPKNVPADRFNYTEAISESSTRQMLTNLVRLRYLRFPTFLSVTSVITNYTYRGDVGVRGQGGLNSTPVQGAGSLIGGSANLTYSERPTITYTPLSGESFTHRMIRPIPMGAISSLGQSGWPVDLLLLTGIHRINKVENLAFAPVPAPGEIDRKQQIRNNLAKYEEFKRVIQIFLIMFDAEAIEVQQRADNPSELDLVIGKKIPPEYQPLETEFRTILGLDPTRNRFRITARATGLQPDEISIQTRSLLATMLFLSKGVDVPKADLIEGRALSVSTELENPPAPLVPLHVKTSPTSPEQAFVAVQYRGEWFYVDDTDLRSQRTFTLLMFLFELQAPAGGGAAPLLTLPTG